MPKQPTHIERHICHNTSNSTDFCAENVTNSMLNIMSVKEVNIPVKKEREYLFLLPVMISSNLNKDEVESKKQEKLISAQRLAVL